MSNSNSQTNLSSLSIEDNLKAEPKSELFHDRELTGIQNPGIQNPDSDSSDEEELLQNVIKSAWQHNSNVSKVIAMFKTKKHRQIQYHRNVLYKNFIHSFWKNPWVINPIMETTRQIQCNTCKAKAFMQPAFIQTKINTKTYITNLVKSFIQMQS